MGKKSCDFRTSEASTKAWLRTQGIIDNFLNIKDLKKFRKENKKWTNYARVKFKVNEGPLFAEEQGGTKAIPNKVAFRKIDAERGVTPVYKQKSPTIRNQQDINKTVEGKLRTFLSTHGISVKFVDSLSELGYDGIAIADLTNKLIAISKNEMDASTLPEEVAHIAVEVLGEHNPIVKQLMDKIQMTDLYEQTYEEYKHDSEYQTEGKPDSKKIAKEAIGKAVAAQILNQKPTETGIIGNIKRLWDKFTSIFKKVNQKALNAEVDRLSGMLASDIINNAIDPTSRKLDGIFKQKSNPKAKKEVERANLAIGALITRKKNLERKAGLEPKVAKHRVDIRKIERLIQANMAISGIGYYVDTVKEEAAQLSEIITQLQNNSKSLALDSKILTNLKDFHVVHYETLASIRGMFKNDPSIMERGEEVYEEVENTLRLMEDIKDFYEESLKQEVINIVGKEASQETGYSGEELFDIVHEDTSWLRKVVGNLKNAKDEILRITYNIIAKAKFKADKTTLYRGKDLAAAQEVMEKAGQRDFAKFHEKYTKGEFKGKKTGNLISEYNLGDYYAEMDKVKDALVKEFGLESYSDIDVYHLSDEHKATFRHAWSEFHKKHSKADGTIGDQYLNPVFKSLTKEEKAYYNVLNAMRMETFELLPKSYSSNRDRMMLPQMRKSALDRLKMSEQNIFKNFKETMTEAITLEEDEIDYGEYDKSTGEVGKRLPIFYVNKLDNPENLSNDMTGMMVGFYHMGQQYIEKAKIGDDLMLIKEALHNRKYKDKRGQVHEGATTNTMDLFNTFLDAHFYGQKKVAKAPMKFRGKVIKIKGKPVYWDQIGDRINKYVRANNLAFSPFTHLANYGVGSIYSKIEDFAGKYTTQEAKLFAETTLDANYPGIFSELNKKNKTNKVSLLFELNNVTKSTEEIYKNMNAKGDFGRRLLNEGVYTTYGMVDFRVKGKEMLAVYGSYKLIDGQFMTKYQLKEKYADKSKEEQNKMWSESKTNLYDAYEVVGNKIQIKKDFKDKVPSSLEYTVKNRINQIAELADGKLSELDRGAIYRNVIGRLMMTHRAWLISGMEARWSPKGFNYTTGEWEEGYHRTFFRNLIGSLVDNKHNLAAHIKDYKKLSPMEKSNMKKAFGDFMFIIMVGVLSGIINGMADDDKDDYWLQFSAYMGSRLELETQAFTNPLEVFDILESPAAGLTQLESIVDFAEMLLTTTDDGSWKVTEKLDRGVYKGYTRWQKLLIKRSLIKNLFEAQDPRYKNVFVKQKLFGAG